MNAADDLELALALIDAAVVDSETRARIRLHLSRYIEAITPDYEIDFSLDDSN